MQSADFFSTDYETSRKRFIEGARLQNARLESLPLSCVSPQGEPLSIDIAWLGHPEPRKILLHTSGIHGVEGFAGSAIQLKLLKDPPRVSPDGALILVHILNPYGMSHLRRANANNVDLNRNYVFGHGVPDLTSEVYRDMNAILNPRSSSPFAFFYLKAFMGILRHGYSKVEKTIAAGQYEYPKGIFYGGKEIEEELRQYEKWLKESFCKGNVETVFAVDVHTGVGKWGREGLFIGPKEDLADQQHLAKIFNKPVHISAQNDVLPYSTLGPICFMLPDLLCVSKVHSVVQEFGTYPGIRVIYALREENFADQCRGIKDTGHRAKLRLKEAFCPADEGWREKVLANGEALMRLAALHLFG